MKQIKCIDCFASVERWSGKDPEAPWTVEKMLADMERCRIHGALIYSNYAKELQPSVGNKYVVDLSRKHPRLIPCWVALPGICGEAAEGGKFVLEMLDNGVKAVKLFPNMHRYLLNDATMGSLLNALQEAELPVIFDRGEHEPAVQQIDWLEIEPLMIKYPKLKVILHSVRWESTRYLFPLLQKFHNLYFEFSNHQGNRIIEFLVEKIGSDQLLFGTQMMEKSPGAAKAFIDYAEIDERDRRKIAGENLIRLLKLENVPVDYTDDCIDDIILQKARKAEPIDDMEVIDSHAHISEEDQYDNIIAFMPKSDAAGIVERNKRIGVDITCVSPWKGIWSGDRAGNEITHQAITEFPENIIGYATFDPNYMTDWQTELKRCYEQHRMKGIKPYYPRNRVPYNDQRYVPWFNYGNEHRLFALMHFSDNFTIEMEELAEKYLEISFLLAHCGMSFETARKHVEMAKKFNNIFLEITYTAVTNGVIEYMVREVGSEKVLYGSDTAMRDPFPQFGWLAYANISEAEKRNIFGGNMRKIIDRCFSK